MSHFHCLQGTGSVKTWRLFSMFCSVLCFQRPSNGQIQMEFAGFGDSKFIFMGNFGEI